MPLLGFYFCWAACADLIREIHIENGAINGEGLKVRKHLPLSVNEFIDTKLGDEDFNQEGNSVSEEYLKKRYYEDFTLASIGITEGSHPFDVANCWEDYDLLAPKIEERFKEWKAGKDVNRPWGDFGGNIEHKPESETPKTII